MRTEQCDQEDMAIYVVLTQAKQMSSDQLQKVKELAGGVTGGQRMIFERGVNSDVRLAV